MQALFEVILPVFLLIGFGYLANWRRWIGDGAIDGLMTFAQSFAVPCLLFQSIARLDLGAEFDLGLLVSFYAGAFVCFGLGYVGARRLFRRTPVDAVAIGFVCLFSNTLLLGLPIMERAYGSEALAGNFAIISIHAPLLYAAGVTAMEFARSQGSGLPARRVARQIGRSLVRNPLVIGISLGLVVNLARIPMPEPVMAGVGMMARAALPAALFGLGGVLVRYRPEGDTKTILMVCVLSLAVHPAITWGLGRHVFALSVDQLRSAVVTASAAPGINAFLFSSMYGAARRVAASSVLISTALALLTVWFWISVLP
ncbi:AEC family transporter [Defluviimonas sp. WL0002]|uniref:AEC family transporter n=1 Tax=Albidovulum marisflavi TaxID=2984159 RepID=A0ABT2ZAZ7_9RHOB|nr:AEC family transporter [Defluviimonas sp. WL0002]MCV2868313.1 AEC family transporter [Defluviimonas sp. WL0002]